MRLWTLFRLLLAGTFAAVVGYSAWTLTETEEDGAPPPAALPFVAPMPAADPAPLQLVKVYRVYRFDVDQAHFPPAPYSATGAIQSWWTRLVSVPVPDAQVGDEVEVAAQIQLAGYHFASSCWTPTGVTVTHGEAWPFDSQV